MGIIEKEKDEEAIQEAMKKIPSLQDVYNVYRKWLHIEDTKRLDIGLAVYLSRKMEGTPIWLIFVGPSGDMKSEQIRALNDEESSITFQRFTSKTLISGDRKVGLGEDYCAIFYKDNQKVLLIYDLSQLLKLPTIEKAEVWAQLRDLYDGSLQRSFGNKISKYYKNLRVTLIAGSTPHLDSQILIHQDLGTRELLYRTSKVKNPKNIINMVLKNEMEEENMRTELHNTTCEFLKYKTIKNEMLTEEQIDKITKFVKYLSYMRAIADTDSFSGEIRADVSVEMPTRIVKQFKRIFIALKSLEKNYSDERAFEILKHITLSSCDQNRIKIYHYIKDIKDRLSTSKISHAVNLGKKTTYKELAILNNLGLICHDIEEMDFGRTYDYWYYNEKKCVNLPFV